MSVVGQAARLVSPRHRRWRRLLASLDLDPDGLARPVAAPGPNDFIICGSSRTGTTLVAAALYQPPRVVTVVEPWDGFRLPPSELFASLRSEIERTGRLARGRLDVPRLEAASEVKWVRDAEISYPVATEPGYLLGVKWPAFWRYLDLLPDTKFVVCLRDPVEVVTSYRLAGGRVSAGLDYDVAFHRTMNDTLSRATDDVAQRRVLLFDYIGERIAPHLRRDNVFVVRYERWFEDADGLLDELAAFLGVELAHDRVRLDRPRSQRAVDADERAFVVEHCHTAAALGYDFDG